MNKAQKYLLRTWEIQYKEESPCNLGTDFNYYASETIVDYAAWLFRHFNDVVDMYERTG